MKVINCYLSKGKSVIDGKEVEWNNVVLEVLTNNFIDNNQMKETCIFGGKFEKLKIKYERFIKLYTNDPKELQNKDILIYYDNNKNPIKLDIVK